MRYFISSLFIVLLLSFPGLGSDTVFMDLSQVLEVMADSRTTRDLKEYGSEASRRSFVEMLESQVYRPVDEAVIRHVQANPEYQGKRVITHDFRTPGSDTSSVNTDRDVRVLVEVEPNRWIEAPAHEWQDVYYKEFARQTGFDGSVDTAARVELQQHADYYRQLPTDRFHREASLDYTDQGRKVNYTVDGHGRLVRQVGTDSTVQVSSADEVSSVSQVARVKRGEGLLLDPEGLALMYYEKGADQFRRAAALEQRINQLSNNDPLRINLESQKHMFETEGVVQSKKAVESLISLRNSYSRMGYDVGAVPERLNNVLAEIQMVKGTSGTDMQKIQQILRQNQFNDLTSFNRALSGQIESLKLSRQKPVVEAAPVRPRNALQRAGTVAGWAGTALSVRDSLVRAEQGQHVLLNFEQEDTDLERGLKTVAVAAMELGPLSIIDAAERGWAIDQEEKHFLEERIRLGEDGTWLTHPLTSTVRVVGKTFYRTARSLTVDPLLLGGEAVLEGYKAGRDVLSNVLEYGAKIDTLQTQQEMREDYWERVHDFGLGSLWVERADGRTSLLSPFTPGEVVTISTTPNENWTSSFTAQWEWQRPNESVEIIDRINAANPESHQVVWQVPEESYLSHTIRLRIFDDAQGLQVDYEEVTLQIAEEPKLGTLRAELHGGLSAEGPLDVGTPFIFTTTKLGSWLPSHIVEWYVSGENWIRGSGDTEGIEQQILDTEYMSPGTYTITVQLLDEQRKLLDYQQVQIELVDSKVEESIDAAYFDSVFLANKDNPYQKVTVFAAGEQPQIIATIKGDAELWPVQVQVLVSDEDYNIIDSSEYQINVPGSYRMPVPYEAISSKIGEEDMWFWVDVVMEDQYANKDQRSLSGIVETQQSLTLAGDEYIEPEQWYVYELNIPPRFTPPFRFSIETVGGLDVDWQDGDRQIMLKAESSEWPRQAGISIVVIDAAGIREEAWLEIDILAAEADWDDWVSPEETVVVYEDDTYHETDVGSENAQADLFAAIRSGDLDQVKQLIKDGVDIQSVKNQSSYPYTPLMEAATYLQPAIVQELLSAGADASFVSNWKENAILMAVKTNQDVLDQYIETLGCELQASDYADYIVSGMIPVLAKAGANVNNVDLLDRTPLHWVVNYGMVETAHALVIAGARTNIANRDGTPREYAEKILKSEQLRASGYEERGDTNSKHYQRHVGAIARLQRLISIL